MERVLNTLCKAVNAIQFKGYDWDSEEDAFIRSFVNPATGHFTKSNCCVLVVVFSVRLIWLGYRYALHISLAAVTLPVIHGFYLRIVITRVHRD